MSRPSNASKKAAEYDSDPIRLASALLAEQARVELLASRYDECDLCGAFINDPTAHGVWHARLAEHVHVTPSDDGFVNRSGKPEVRSIDANYTPMSPLPPRCPRCNKYGFDAFGPQELTTGWHMGCAADFAHERARDRVE